MKTFDELSEAERLAFATDSLLGIGGPVIRHSRLGIEIDVGTMDQVMEWYLDWRNGKWSGKITPS